MAARGVDRLAFLAVLLARAQVASRTIADNRIDLHLDAAEADAALDLADKARPGGAISDEEWATVSGTEGYRRLQRREKEMGSRATDGEFRAFLLSEDLARERATLRTTLEE
ncbi:MAG TPA: hypothetical protein VKF62_04015, partial [Planctomycetota bacterium]|nr:hypothetical protein [Planctomycetota bacterium]